MSILFFWSDSPSEPLGFCCQWYRSEFQSEDGKSFNCAEQYMMWRKASLFGDYDTAKAILGTTSAKKQKQLGRQVKGFDGEKWDQLDGNYLKFMQASTLAGDANNEDGIYSRPLKKVLLSTGDSELVEASPFDRIWGIGFNAVDAAATDREQWGENLLGKALMEVRERVKK